MRWYDQKNSINDKVRSVVFAVENRDKQLWGVAEYRISGKLTPAEIVALKDYITRQSADA